MTAKTFNCEAFEHLPPHHKQDPKKAALYEIHCKLTTQSASPIAVEVTTNSDVKPAAISIYSKEYVITGANSVPPVQDRMPEDMLEALKISHEKTQFQSTGTPTVVKPDKESSYWSFAPFAVAGTVILAAIAGVAYSLLGKKDISTSQTKTSIIGDRSDGMRSDPDTVQPPAPGGSRSSGLPIMPPSVSLAGGGGADHVARQLLSPDDALRAAAAAEFTMEFPDYRPAVAVPAAAALKANGHHEDRRGGDSAGSPGTRLTVPAVPVAMDMEPEYGRGSPFTGFGTPQNGDSDDDVEREGDVAPEAATSGGVVVDLGVRVPRGGGGASPVVLQRPAAVPAAAHEDGGGAATELSLGRYVKTAVAAHEVAHARGMSARTTEALTTAVRAEYAVQLRDLKAGDALDIGGERVIRMDADGGLTVEEIPESGVAAPAPAPAPVIPNVVLSQALPSASTAGDGTAAEEATRALRDTDVMGGDGRGGDDA